ncbi:hypothetical protein [Spirosoma rhododendri]|uniref:Uncharacterized protein n=1 Tax=Spirosoma rhododendri TaxID=2728024 RepID=A0A7L5DZV8_9BACT|nr:hypothetical protein [Spirosoma rhododendri]QJD81517.1 hypothetical protein HH216_24405 [Spirosoma rhododendri]
MANQDKKNKNVKKAPTKSVKTSGLASIPAYLRREAAFTAAHPTDKKPNK